MATQDELVGDVLTVLCAAGAYWTSCSVNPNGVTEATLLTELQTQFPNDGWTTTQLATILEYGARRGSLTACRTVDPITWYARSDMVRRNPQNEQYREVCPNIFQQRPAEPNQYTFG